MWTRIVSSLKLDRRLTLDRRHQTQCVVEHARALVMAARVCFCLLPGSDLSHEAFCSIAGTAREHVPPNGALDFAQVSVECIHEFIDRLFCG